MAYPRFMPGDFVEYNGRRGRVVFHCELRKGTGPYTKYIHSGLTRGVIVEWPDESVVHFLNPEMILLPADGSRSPQPPDGA
jgi:hypothetical protein